MELGWLGTVSNGMERGNIEAASAAGKLQLFKWVFLSRRHCVLVSLGEWVPGW